MSSQSKLYLINIFFAALIKSLWNWLNCLWQIIRFGNRWFSFITHWSPIQLLNDYVCIHFYEVYLLFLEQCNSVLSFTQSKFMSFKYNISVSHYISIDFLCKCSLNFFHLSASACVFWDNLMIGFMRTKFLIRHVAVN